MNNFNNSQGYQSNNSINIDIYSVKNLLNKIEKKSLRNLNQEKNNQNKKSKEKINTKSYYELKKSNKKSRKIEYINLTLDAREMIDLFPSTISSPQTGQLSQKTSVKHLKYVDK